MVNRSFAALLPVCLMLAGCNLLMPHMGAGSPDANKAEPGKVTDDVKQAVRKQEAAADQMEAQMGNIENEQVERAEKDLVKALQQALGKQAAAPGMPPPESASVAFKAIRDGKIKVRLEAVVDQDGHPLNDNFLQLKDSYTDRVQQLQRKMVEKTATPAEMKEIQSGAKYAMKLSDLRQQVMTLSMVTMTSNSQLQNTSMTTMLRIAQMVKTRKQMEMEMNDADWGRIKKWLERQHRIETIAAASMGALTIYQAILNNNGDPKALDGYAEKAVTAFPVQASVTDDEAKNYVKNLKGNIAAVKTEYESMLRKVHGDAKYEAQYKAGIDAMFRQAGEQPKTPAQVMSETNAKYQQDLEKCGHGEPISPGSMVSGPKCKEARQAALEGHPLTASGAPAAEESSSGGGLGALLGAIPGLNIVKASLDGIQALAKGDVKGAFGAAVSLVPGGGPIKDALNNASSMLGKA